MYYRPKENAWLNCKLLLVNSSFREIAYQIDNQTSLLFNGLSYKKNLCGMIEWFGKIIFTLILMAKIDIVKWQTSVW